MGKVDAIAVAGLSLWFNSNDHLPPHFHALRTGQWEIRVYFLECVPGHLEYDVKWGRSPSGGDRRTLLGLVLGARVELLVEWEQKVCR